MGIQIVEFFQTFINDVIAEFSEGNMRLGVVFLFKLLKLSMRVVNFEVPLAGQKRNSISKFLLGNSSFSININGFEILPEFVVEFEVNEEELEFSPGNIIISEGVS